MHKNLYMAIILGANMLYINFCLFKETPMAPKGLTMVNALLYDETYCYIIAIIMYLYPINASYT